MKRLFTNYSLHQLIDEPTYFTENSSSLLDLVISNNLNFVPYSGVGPPLLDQVRYHCPVVGFLNTPKPDCKSFKRKVWLYNKGNFNEFRQNLAVVNWDSIFNSDNIDEITLGISSNIIRAAEKTIPNKIVTIRKSDPKWLTNDIRRLIRKKIVLIRKQNVIIIL